MLLLYAAACSFNIAQTRFFSRWVFRVVSIGFTAIDFDDIYTSEIDQ